ncbi:MAG: hypothetical protein K8S16_17925 [Bacteroidales bacterium]|nr:hypothetical protein [Bacteroidales bacterium]
MKEIKLLEAQIKKLENKGFDLDAWKQYTVVLLARIFGEQNPKIRQIEKIEYDFSSWALRDTTGKSAYMDTCKKLGREVLQASIDELNAFGLPEKETVKEKSLPVSIIEQALEDELKVSQIRKLKEIVNSGMKEDKKKEALQTLFKSFDKNFLENMLLHILSSPDLLFIEQ